MIKKIKVTAHAQLCHLQVTRDVTVTTVKTIVIAGYLSYQITPISIALQYKRVVKTTQVAYCGSFGMQFLCQVI